MVPTPLAPSCSDFHIELNIIPDGSDATQPRYDHASSHANRPLAFAHSDETDSAEAMQLIRQSVPLHLSSLLATLPPERHDDSRYRSQIAPAGGPQFNENGRHNVRNDLGPAPRSRQIAGAQAGKTRHKPRCQRSLRPAIDKRRQPEISTAVQSRRPGTFTDRLSESCGWLSAIRPRPGPRRECPTGPSRRRNSSGRWRPNRPLPDWSRWAKTISASATSRSPTCALQSTTPPSGRTSSSVAV